MKMKRFLCLLLLLLVCSCSAMADTNLPYDCYNYDYWNNILYTPAPYVPNRLILGTDLAWQGEKIGAFRTPQDFCVSPDGNLYIADTGNNRIVVLDGTLKNVVKVINGFTENGTEQTFSAPYGVAVSEKGMLYIADSQNRRIVVLDQRDNFVKYV